MMSRSYTVFAIAAVSTLAVLGSWMLDRSVGQPPAPPAPQAPQPSERFYPLVGPATLLDDGTLVVRDPAEADPRQAAYQKVTALTKKLQDAGNTKDEKLLKEIESALGEYFERDMDFRRSELDRLRKRADETEAQNQKRERSRTELIDLQLQAFTYDAEGLGLFDDSSRNSGQNRLLFSRTTVLRESTLYTPLVDRSSSFGRSKVVDGRGAAMQRIAKARQEFAAAKDAEAEAKALKELKEALGEYFDRDMEFRRDGLKEVREGLTKLQARLEKRQTAKDAIVSLRLKMIVNEANGLGFFSGDPAVSWSIQGSGAFTPSWEPKLTWRSGPRR